MYMKDLKEASYKIFQLKAIMESNEPKDISATNFIPESSPITFDVTVNHIKTSDKDNNSKKVLILGDECVKGLRPHLVKLLKANYAVQAIIKPGAKFGDVINNLSALLNGYGEDDYVVIMGGINDFLQGKVPKIKNIWTTLKLCMHTNIFFFIYTLP
ncbi:unnamed protein product [Ceutorhynchus assimilis]|uniref:Uncharacterized protein n=1 Tax=Ceutorhynchus assimilis TaxID=467358 RepID=A0A9N9QQ02_9CUCU|nr:unnamed protein product [Ceutorhynchus assimilis]